MGTDAQCPVCAAADNGRRIARDAALGDDGRDYMLYLAWFGPGLIKTGLTAVDRGRDRLLEQAAIAFTPLAAGPYTPVRQAERLISTAGLAAERVGARAKTTAWWTLPPPAERSAQLAAARERVARGVSWPGRLLMLPLQVTDHAAEFGLDEPLPARYGEVTGFTGPATLAGQIRVTAGHHLMILTDTGPVLADMRHACGLLIRPAGPAASTSGLSLAFRTPQRASDDRQSALF